MVSTGAALAVHDLKNELGALEAALDRLAVQPDGPTARSAQRQCRALRQRFVSYLTLYGQGERLRAQCEDESPLALLQLIAARHAGAEMPAQVVVDEASGAPDAPAFWYFDRRLVGMALDAAVHNALRFARHQVVLSAHLEDAHLVFSVEDDGPGLDPHAEPDAHATGLGTALCRAVAASHGTRRQDGGVRLFNREGGAGRPSGARFELWLAT
jgi:signal transduction histidine kinase